MMQTETVAQPEVAKAPRSKSADKQGTKPNLRYQRDKDREKVKGIFRFYEVPGGVMMFCYKAYREDEVENFTLVDGEMYTLPLGVAKHLNKNGWYPEYEYVKGEKDTQAAYGGAQGMRIGKKVRRYGFQSLEFIDDSDLTQVGNPIITVERI